MKKIPYLRVAIFAFIHNIGIGQQTINPNNTSAFLLGGGQASNFAVLNLRPISLIDAEPDPSNTINFGVSSNSLEAGLPAMGVGGVQTNESIWLNFTYRALNLATAKIYVATNQSVPAGMVIKIQVINTIKIGGIFNSNPNITPITLSTTQQVLVYDFSSGYTGNGLGTGYNLRCSIENPNGISLPTGFKITYEIK